jgi:hypothetical protein
MIKTHEANEMNLFEFLGEAFAMILIAGGVVAVVYWTNARIARKNRERRFDDD